MASRWRTWDSEAHVDSHGLATKVSFGFERVRHSFDWNDVPELLKTVVVPEEICQKIREDNAATKYGMQGISGGLSVSSGNTHDQYCSISGRAEALRMRLGARVPGTIMTEEKDSTGKKASPVDGCNSTQVVDVTPDFTPDEQTLYFKHLPNNLTEKELKGSVELFGKVAACKVYQEDTEATAFVRLEEPSACDWVISYFRGMPYDDASAPLECDYVLERTYS